MNIWNKIGADLYVNTVDVMHKASKRIYTAGTCQVTGAEKGLFEPVIM